MFNMFGRKTRNYKIVNNTVDDIDDFDLQRNDVKFRNCLRSSIFTITLIVIYYVPSIGLTFYQHWLYESFHYPLTTVLIHLIIKFLLALLVRIVLKKQQGRKPKVLDWKQYIMSLAPAGICSGIDIGFSNWGLELVTISLYTMTKSTTIIFILIFSIVLKLEKKSWSLNTIVTVISVGLMLFTYESTQFNFVGFMLCLLASASSGIRWTCVQLFMQKKSLDIHNPIDMIYHMQPFMILSILPFTAIFEGSMVISNCQLFLFTEYNTFAYIVFKIVIGAFIAFCMEIGEVLVVTYTSSLTLSIAGIFKELFVVGLAVVLKGDKLSFINLTGLCVCIVGITTHVLHKIKTMPLKSMERSYINESGNQELGQLFNQLDDVISESEDEKSDSQVIFNILKNRDG